MAPNAEQAGSSADAAPRGSLSATGGSDSTQNLLAVSSTDAGETPRRDAVAVVTPLDDFEAALHRQQRFGVWAANAIEREQAERRHWFDPLLEWFCCCLCPRSEWPPPEITKLGSADAAQTDDDRLPTE